MKRNRAEFTDAKGMNWRCRMSTRRLMEASRDLGITIDQLTSDASKKNVGSMIGLIWYACKHIAKANNITEEEFYDERVMLAYIGDACLAVQEALQDAFKRTVKENVPLASQAAPGKKPTS